MVLNKKGIAGCFTGSLGLAAGIGIGLLAAGLAVTPVGWAVLGAAALVGAVAAIAYGPENCGFLKGLGFGVGCTILSIPIVGVVASGHGDTVADALQVGSGPDIRASKSEKKTPDPKLNVQGNSPPSPHAAQSPRVPPNVASSPKVIAQHLGGNIAHPSPPPYQEKAGVIEVGAGNVGSRQQVQLRGNVAGKPAPKNDAVPPLPSYLKDNPPEEPPKSYFRKR